MASGLRQLTLKRVMNTPTLNINEVLTIAGAANLTYPLLSTNAIRAWALTVVGSTNISGNGMP